MKIKKQSTIVETTVFLLLIALTLVTYQVGKMGLSGVNISLGVFAIALFKGALISEHFMQLKHASGLWRWMILIWLILLGIVIYLAFTA
jgi:cytochrome c oxidase subunit IV